MFVIGLSGGVGSGKSVVAELLAAHGTYLIDADEVAREVVAPGTQGLSAVESRFGPGILRTDGSLDRQKLAEIVFSDQIALNDLNSIVHPLVRQEIDDQLSGLAGGNDVVVLSVPLFVESGHYRSDCLIVVDVDEEIAVGRLVAARGWTHQQAMARIAAQASRAERVAAADYVIDNNGTLDDLRREVDKAWQWIEGRQSR